MPETEKVVYKAYPLGFCAGVAWSIRNAERALADGPVIGLGNLVNNFPVVRGLESQGMTFVEDITEVSSGSTVMISAHGLSDSERQELAKKETKVIDSTCPLVANVHTRVKRARELAENMGREWEVLYICKDLQHREPRGVIGESPENITPIRTEEDIKKLVPVPGRLYFVDTQTTLNLDKAAVWIQQIKDKIPDVKVPPLGDVCFATKNRQGALSLVLAEEPQVLLAFGSKISSNTGELVKMGKRAGAEVFLVETIDEVKPELVDGKTKVAVTAGASANPAGPDACMELLSSWGYKGVDMVFGKLEPSYFDIMPNVQDFR